MDPMSENRPCLNQRVDMAAPRDQGSQAEADSLVRQGCRDDTPSVSETLGARKYRGDEEPQVSRELSPGVLFEAAESG